MYIVNDMVIKGENTIAICTQIVTIKVCCSIIISAKLYYDNKYPSSLARPEIYYRNLHMQYTKKYYRID